MKSIAEDENESYYIQGSALITISNYKNEMSLDILIKAIDKENTYNDIIPQRAISGLANLLMHRMTLKETPNNSLLIKQIVINSNAIRSIATNILGSMDIISGNSFFLDNR